ncbi:kinase-like domain-containing protein [Vararia minispora EC-137]|uniref:Kinase-like domain-containing protein n=1 Tax=Vararia minispora EC-137 TaxID=1314806 RepID=A0ACB8QA39_9AGAM|nr:kinase-like domain-containing protein [Vararia minispora EC-137]
MPTSPVRGFRIGRASTAVKRFFPGEDDEDAPKWSPAVRTQVYPPPSTARFIPGTAVPTPSSRPVPAEQSTAQSLDVKTVNPPLETPQHQQPEHHLPTAATPAKPSLQQALHLRDSATSANSPQVSSGELYEIVSQVGEGTFGKVYKARNSLNGLHVALKRIRMETEKDGFPVTAMREIKLLQSLRNDNVVQLYEMMVSNGMHLSSLRSAYMVFEYMDHDLTGILAQTQFQFTDAHLKSFCRQMLAGLAYLHRKGVVHRDIKGSNILVNNRGELKLADFGLARFYQKRRKSDYTNRVITLWYRPPELLFGATVYGPEVDMWSAGCIMLELFTKKPIFQGNDELHQLEFIFKILGTPTVEQWPSVVNLPWYELVKPKEFMPSHFRDFFKKWLSPAGLDLAEQLLAYDPQKRISALDAMRTPYFLTEEPPEARPVDLATLEGEWHELETKRERAKKRRRTEEGKMTQ